MSNSISNSRKIYKNFARTSFQCHYFFYLQEREVEHLEGVVASLKQELGLAKKRVSELQHALEDDMHYDSEGMSNDDDDDDDIDLNLSDDSDDFKDSGSRPSEPRSYRSLDELDDEDDLSDRLKRKLNDLKDDLPRSTRGSRPPADSVDSDVFENTVRHDDDLNDSRKGGRSASHEGRRRSRSEPKDENDTSVEKRRQRSEEKRRKSVEKRRSFEKKSKDNSIH